METDLEKEQEQIALTILDQMGGAARIQAMIGAKNILWGVNDEKNVFVRILYPWLNTRNNANMFEITYDRVLDLYHAVFWRVKGINTTQKGSFTGIYAEGLIDLFERETGLYLRLVPQQ